MNKESMIEFTEQGHALSAPQIVFPPDERKQVTKTTEYPWITIGQLSMSFPNGETCTGTGTLIDRQHVLTAAHNVFGREIGGWAKEVDFQPAGDGTTLPYGTVGASKVFITEDYFTLSPADPNLTADGTVKDCTLYTQDYAVVRLAKPLDLPFMGIYATSDIQLDGVEARITGYPADKPRGTMWTAKGRLAKPDEHFLFYKIDTWKGESGAGLFVDLEMPYGKSLVGVHVAGMLDSNFAVRLTHTEVKQINAWMQAK